MSELDIYRRQGFGQSSGFGRHPALVVVDFVNGFNDATAFGGGNIDASIKRTRVLLDACRRLKLPIAFTRVVYADDGGDLGVFALKTASLKNLTETSPLSQVVPELTPLPGEYIVRKQQPSAFFGTSLIGWLTMQGVDTLLIAGCTTSGCVRATVIDSMSYNFRTIVVTDCVGDRAQAPHDANLFDMGQKYADLMTCDEVVPVLQRIAAVAS